MSASVPPVPAPRPAPELDVSQWFNTTGDLSLARLRGRVVLIEAFQMLCPGCVAHGLPLAQRAQATFGPELQVVGLHTVFEHHAAMTPVSLEAFLHEYRITFPVGVDRAVPGDTVPSTMRRYELRGTPSLVLVDRSGRLRHHAFGQIDELALGAAVARLLDEPAPDDDPDAACAADGCLVPQR